MTLQETFESLVKEAHSTAVEKGWHEKEVTVPHALMMIVDEITEMMLEYRFKSSQEFIYREMADVFIRLFDFMGQQNFDVPQFVKALEEKMEANKKRPFWKSSGQETGTNCNVEYFVLQKDLGGK